MTGPSGAGRGTRHALLMSGGIGDYLHYLTRLDTWLAASGLDRDAVDVFVESTVPHAVRTLFDRACPDLRVSFVPGAIHWTKTNPLLNAEREIDRVNRPAYGYVAARGFETITDWFLPFRCHGYTAQPQRLSAIVDSPPPVNRYVVCSARDKGFLWWPDETLCRRVEQQIPSGIDVVYLGTPNERQPYMTRFVVAGDIAEALTISYHAMLFVGTDTGTATVRELMGKPCVYCVNQFWIDELMIRYGYWSSEYARRSSSILACSSDELLAGCASVLPPRMTSLEARSRLNASAFERSERQHRKNNHR